MGPSHVIHDALLLKIEPGNLLTFVTGDKTFTIQRDYLDYHHPFMLRVGDTYRVDIEWFKAKSLGLRQ